MSPIVINTSILLHPNTRQRPGWREYHKEALSNYLLPYYQVHGRRAEEDVETLDTRSMDAVACHYENDTFWRLGPPGSVRGAPGGGPGSDRDAIPYR